MGKSGTYLRLDNQAFFGGRPYEHHRMTHARVKTTLMCGLITVDSVKAITQ